MGDKKTLHGKGSLARSQAQKMVITVHRQGDGMKCHGDLRTNQAGRD